MANCQFKDILTTKYQIEQKFPCVLILEASLILFQSKFQT